MVWCPPSLSSEPHSTPKVHFLLPFPTFSTQQQHRLENSILPLILFSDFPLNSGPATLGALLHQDLCTCYPPFLKCSPFAFPFYNLSPSFKITFSGWSALTTLFRAHLFTFLSAIRGNSPLLEINSPLFGIKSVDHLFHLITSAVISFF